MNISEISIGTISYIWFKRLNQLHWKKHFGKRQKSVSLRWARPNKTWYVIIATKAISVKTFEELPLLVQSTKNQKSHGTNATETENRFLLKKKGLKSKIELLGVWFGNWSKSISSYWFFWAFMKCSKRKMGISGILQWSLAQNYASCQLNITDINLRHLEIHISTGRAGNLWE